MQGEMRRELLLPAEPPAGGRLNDPHGAFVPAEGMRERLDDVVRALERALQHEHVAVEPGRHALGLEIDVLLGAGLVDALDHDRRAPQCLLDLTLGDAEMFEHVVAAELDLVRRGGGAKVEDGGIPVDDDLDGVHRSPQRRPGWVRQEHDGLVHMPYPIRGEDRLVVFDERHDVGSGDVPVIDDDVLRPVDTGAEPDVANPATRRRAAHGHAPPAALDRQVVDVRLPAGELGESFASQHREQ